MNDWGRREWKKTDVDYCHIRIERRLQKCAGKIGLKSGKIGNIMLRFTECEEVKVLSCNKVYVTKFKILRISVR